MWEQLSLAAFLQRHWADNQVRRPLPRPRCSPPHANHSAAPLQVSCTVTFDPDTEGPYLKNALDVFQYQLKVCVKWMGVCRPLWYTRFPMPMTQGVSFLPRAEVGAYPQMPYEAVTEAVYHDMLSKLKPLDFSGVSGSDTGMAAAAGPCSFTLNRVCMCLYTRVDILRAA